MESNKILVVNAGSSSLKSSLYSGEELKLIWKGHIQWKEKFQNAVLKSSTPSNQSIEKELKIDSVSEGLKYLLDTLLNPPLKVINNPNEISAIGHRVVLGGEKFVKTTFIDDEVKKKIEELSPLAPLHNPANLEGIKATEQNFPNIFQYAVFDTSFHASLPESASTYAGPYSWKEHGIKRFGFHGISHQYCSKQAAKFLNKDLDSLKILNCHLGAGASLCAIREGKSVDTTMGFTPLEGLMMASRSGSVDPGIIFHLIKHQSIAPEKLEHILNFESGLLGLSGISDDMRDLIEAYENNPRAKLALDVFIHRLKSCMGMMIASLGGIDTLVFTAGIGENSPHIRKAACEAFSFLGLEIDDEKNNSSSKEDMEISSSKSKIKVLVIPTQEEWEIAHECLNQQSYRS